MTTTVRERRPLSAYVHVWLLAVARRLLADFNDDEEGQAVRDALAAWCLGVLTDPDRLVVVAEVDKRRDGRIDSRSGTAVVYCRTSDRSHLAELGRVRLRYLTTAEGQPFDAQAETRRLLDEARGLTDADIAALLDDEDGRL